MKNGFYWYDEEGLHSVTAAQLTAEENKGKTITTLTNTVYRYFPTTLKNTSQGEVKGIAATTAVYKMLFRNSDDTANTNYWLASPYVQTGSAGVGFGLRAVSSGCVSFGGLFSSMGNGEYYGYGVRAVVTLSSDIQLTGSSANGWSY